MFNNLKLEKMKKIMTMLLFIGVTMLISSSCTKTCVCTITETDVDYDGNTQTSTYTEIVDLEEGEKCSDFNSSYSDGEENISVKCKAQYR